MLRGSYGDPLYPTSIYKWKEKFLSSIGLPPIRLHDLRHTHASMLAYMDLEAAQIQKRLGHSDLSTTMDIYTHVFEDRDRKIADDLSDAFFGDEKKDAK